MELNVIELYKLLGENPANFQTVLKNFYGYELAMLINSVSEFVYFLENESGEDASRNRFIEDNFEKLVSELAQVQQNMSYFRYVGICSDGSKMLTSDDLIEILRDSEETAQFAKDDFSKGIKQGDSWKTQDMEAFVVAKKCAMGNLDSIKRRLDGIDELLAI